MEFENKRQSSLVRYKTPILVTTKKEDSREKVAAHVITQDGEPNDEKLPPESTDTSSVSSKTTKRITFASSQPSKSVLPPLEELRKKETEEILNYILPPKEWEENGQLWVQSVSTTPATSVDVQQLQEQLDLRLQEQGAYETGICPLRRELYTQCFDELIRQVTVNCAERGVLLYRMRDEIRETLDAYQRLYTSSCAYGVRKALMAEEAKVKSFSRCEDLRQEVNQLEARAASLRQETDQLGEEAEAARRVEQEKHEEAKQVHEARIQLLKKKLEGIIKQATQNKK